LEWHGGEVQKIQKLATKLVKHGVKRRDQGNYDDWGMPPLPPLDPPLLVACVTEKMRYN